MENKNQNSHFSSKSKILLQSPSFELVSKFLTINFFLKYSNIKFLTKIINFPKKIQFVSSYKKYFSHILTV